MKEELFQELCESIKEAGMIKAGLIEPGRFFEIPNVKLIRQKLKTSQSKFAEMIGVSIHTIQNWEQGKRHPNGPAKVLLKVAEKNPKAIVDALL